MFCFEFQLVVALTNEIVLVLHGDESVLGCVLLGLVLCLFFGEFCVEDDYLLHCLLHSAFLECKGLRCLCEL